MQTFKDLMPMESVTRKGKHEFGFGGGLKMKELLKYSGFRKAIKQTLLLLDMVFIYHACEWAGTRLILPGGSAWYSLLLFVVAAFISRIVVEMKTE